MEENQNESPAAEAVANIDRDDHNKENPYVLLSLNDDCLRCICQRLDLRCQIAFALTCQRFYGVFESNCRVQYKTFDTESLNDLTGSEVDMFFRIAGDYIEEIGDFYQLTRFHSIFDQVYATCKNLKAVALRKCYKLKRPIMEKLRCMTNLRKLSLDCCAIRDEDAYLISFLSELEELSLRRNDVTGRYLSHLTKLRKLNLHSCLLIMPEHFVPICQANGNLESLNIWECIHLNATCFEAVLKYLPNLSDLTMCCASKIGYECVARLPKLKHFRLLSLIIPMRKVLFEDLVKYNADTLETLRVEFFGRTIEELIDLIVKMTNLRELICIDNFYLNDVCVMKLANLKNLEKIVFKSPLPITDKSVLYLLEHCEKLKYINVEHCPQITYHLVFEAIKFLIDCPAERARPLLIYVRDTNIPASIVEHAFYLENRHLVYVSFEEDKKEQDDFVLYRYNEDYYQPEPEEITKI